MEILIEHQAYFQQRAQYFAQYFLMQASDWSLKTRDSDAPIYLAIFQEIFPNIQDALQKTLSDLETDSLGDDFSLPYTFFLLNVDMELNKNREVFVQKMLEKSQAQLQ